jgi:hypothetical protein
MVAAMQKETDSKIFTSARWGLVLMGVVWLIFGAVTVYRLTAGKTYGHPAAGVVVAVLMFGNALAFLVSGWGLSRYPRFFVVISLLLVVVNIILSFTDQVGLFDILTAGVDVMILALLLWIGRDLFFSQR